MNTYERAITEFLAKPENYRVLFEIRPYLDQVLQRKLRERQDIFINRLMQEIRSYPALNKYSPRFDDNGSWIRFSNKNCTDEIEFIIDISMDDRKNCWFGLCPMERFTPELDQQTQSLFPLAPYGSIRYRYFDRLRGFDLYDPDVTEPDLNPLFDDWIKQFLTVVARLEPCLNAATKLKNVNG